MKKKKKKKNLPIPVARTFTYWTRIHGLKNTLGYDKIEVGEESNCSDVRVFRNKLENKRR